MADDPAKTGDDRKLIALVALGEALELQSWTQALQCTQKQLLRGDLLWAAVLSGYASTCRRMCTEGLA